MVCQEQYLHGKYSLYANPTWLHLIKKLKKKENYYVLNIWTQYSSTCKCNESVTIILIHLSVTFLSGQYFETWPYNGVGFYGEKRVRGRDVTTSMAVLLYTLLTLLARAIVKPALKMVMLGKYGEWTETNIAISMSK